MIGNVDPLAEYSARRAKQRKSEWLHDLQIDGSRVGRFVATRFINFQERTTSGSGRFNDLVAKLVERDRQSADYEEEVQLSESAARQALEDGVPPEAVMQELDH